MASSPGASARRVDTHAWPPLGLSREDAAHYIGISATKFDQLVADRRMPRPKRIDGRVVWDRRAIEAAFTELPDDARRNPLDELLGR